MTEAQWLECPEPGPLLQFLSGKLSERKLRFFACACSRRLLPVLRDPRLEEVLILAEQLAEGMASAKERLLVLMDAIQTEFTAKSPTTVTQLSTLGFAAVCCFPKHSLLPLGLDGLVRAVAWDAVPGATVDPDDGRMGNDPEWRAAYVAEQQQQARLLREVVASPFRPVAVTFAWQSPTVTQLAQAIFDEGSWVHLPILADALEEVGCTDDAVLDHCRQPGDHVRGCWVVDLLLGKA
jgi:hypothetical protein